MSTGGEQIVKISGVGRRGDGIATLGEDTIFIPFGLPGETVRVQRTGDRGRLTQVLQTSSERAEPFCQYFGRCGGCSLQHWHEANYKAWKRQLLLEALRQRGIDVDPEPVVDAHGDGRRRVVLHVRHIAGHVQAGFMEARTHHLQDIETCPILASGLRAAPELARVIGRVFGPDYKGLDVQVDATDGGISCHVRGPRDISLDLRMDLASLAQEYGLARLTVGSELVVEQRQPVVLIGQVRVVLPPGGFLQATAKGQELLQALVSTASKGAETVADLFCGIGPFTFELAGRSAVHAIDGNAAAILALTTAARFSQGLRPIRAETRDLYKRPLSSVDLNRYETVILDPPRAGAEAQVRELARSTVPKAVSVSCDVNSFARDAAILIGGGYRLTRIVPIDQFKWSAHLEVFGLFER